jgi:hypothetical protein
MATEKAAPVKYITQAAAMKKCPIVYMRVLIKTLLLPKRFFLIDAMDVFII